MSPNLERDGGISGGAIRTWLAHSNEFNQAPDATFDQAMTWAKPEWNSRKVCPSPTGSFSLDPMLPDRVYALSLIALEDHEVDARVPVSFYRCLRRTTWPFGDL